MAVLTMTVASAEESRALDSRDVALAIECAMRAAIGPLAVAAVTIDGLQWQTARPGLVELEAVPAPGARLGHRMPFTLVDRHARQRVGWASAEVRVEAQYIRARTLIRRGDLLDDAAVVQEMGWLPAMSVVRLDVQPLGGAARRDIRQGEILTARLVAPAVAVRRAEAVTVFAVAGGARIALAAVASENGSIGQVIRVVNPETRRELRARITGKGEAEVLR
jgi:flagella basal body P-ring formation protein FlgA